MLHNIHGATQEYHKAMRARQEQARALARAQIQAKALRFTTEGDFTHLHSGRQSVNFKRGTL